MLRVIDVDYLGKYRLKLSFNNGEILPKTRRNQPGKSHKGTKAQRKTNAVGTVATGKTARLHYQ